MNKKEIEYKINNLLDDSTFEYSKVDEIENTAVNKTKLIETNKTCKNFWCKAPYTVKYYDGDEYPKECPKCIDFDTILSGGVDSDEKHYEGLRQDGVAHEVEFHFSKFQEGKGFWNK